MAIISNGTTIADAGAFSASLGAMTHIKTITASNDANASFHHGTSSVVLDSTYPIYIIKFINVHPATNDTKFFFQANGAGETGFNETITSLAAISVSPVCKVNMEGLSSAVAVCLSITPLSGLEINLTSLSVPNCM